MTADPPRILVVEDDPACLSYLACVLRDWGYTVDEAPSAQEALERVSDHCPVVVISDLVMPGKSGLELLKEIRAIKQPDGSPCVLFFILITGYGTVPKAVHAVLEGADEVLLKPVDPDLLKATLEQHQFKVPHA